VNNYRLFKVNELDKLLHEAEQAVRKGDARLPRRPR
jgi:hypothetical protein